MLPKYACHIPLNKADMKMNIIIGILDGQLCMDDAEFDSSAYCLILN